MQYPQQRKIPRRLTCGAFQTLLIADILFLILLQLCKALTAVNRSVLSGLEGDLSYIAAVGASSFIHLSALLGRILSCVAAGLAALGLVHEAFFSIELLLTGGEHELVAAVLTY